MRFDRITILFFLLAVAVVTPGAWTIQRSLDNSQAVQALTQNQTVIAQQRVDGTIDSCRASNVQRAGQIATSEAAIRAAAQAPPTMLTNEGRLLLTAFVQRTNRAIERVSAPKTCTVKALHLGELAAIAEHK